MGKGGYSVPFSVARVLLVARDICDFKSSPPFVALLPALERVFGDYDACRANRKPLCLSKEGVLTVGTSPLVTVARSSFAPDERREARECAIDRSSFNSPALEGDSTLMPNLNSDGEATDSGSAILAAPGVKPAIV
jgi:hypothetical protein